MAAEEIKMRLDWIGDAARSNNLAAVEVENKETGEPAMALVIIFDDANKADLDIYPVAFMPESMEDMAANWKPKEVARDVKADNESTENGNDSAQGSEA